MDIKATSRVLSLCCNFLLTPVPPKLRTHTAHLGKKPDARSTQAAHTHCAFRKKARLIKALNFAMKILLPHDSLLELRGIEECH